MVNFFQQEDRYHIQCVSYHYSIAHPQAVGGEGLQIWKRATNIKDTLLCIANKG
jgi:hypothetical protein